MLIRADGPAVVLDARTCAWLEQYVDMAALRVRAHGAGQGIHAQLADVRDAARIWREFRASETSGDNLAKPVTRSEWLTSTQAADLAGVSPQAIGRAIREGRLPAGGSSTSGWRVRRADLQTYIDTRKAPR